MSWHCYNPSRKQVRESGRTVCGGAPGPSRGQPPPLGLGLPPAVGPKGAYFPLFALGS
ncbi:hypothetical protein DSO57_1006712 [Entomophthora muscae]|uniref:Uncharacterized protein n=1 Tax=Entomophthora muscae TaxID=34485 RepID=A0ACC2UI69_9FUNG|nr:hypothetical protein DSO57_1006712 [Entomophthora muscae]